MTIKIKIFTFQQGNTLFFWEGHIEPTGRYVPTTDVHLSEVVFDKSCWETEL